VSRASPGGRIGISRCGIAAWIGALLAVVAGFSWVAVKSFDLIHSDVASLRTSHLTPVDIVGPQQTVFSHRTQACEPRDIPDSAARAFRDASGQVHLVASHYVNRGAVGPDLDHVRHDCRVVMASAYNPNPQAFADREWIAAPYTIDGKTVFSLVHDEYQGNQHLNARCLSGRYSECWYNAITLARSNDGGNTFTHALPPPSNLVAEIPYPYKHDAGPFGVFSPSSIVKKGSYYYSMVVVQRYKAQQVGTCVMRTANLADPTAWRAWDGDGFNVNFVNPYKVRNAASGDHFCKPVSPDQIGTMSDSLTYNTYFGKYMLMGSSGVLDQRKRHVVYGFYYSLSDDLVHWSMRKLVRQAELPWTYRCGDPDPVLYPSVLDPASKSRNFDTTGRRPYLYFTRLHYSSCRSNLNRDLVRMPIEFSK